MQARGLMCGNFTSPQGWRLSDLSNPRNTFVRTYAKVNTSGLLPDTASNAWLADVRGVNGIGRRQLWLRCIPDAWIAWDSENERFSPTGPLLLALQGYIGLLTQPPWAIRTVTSLTQSAAKARITSIANGALGGTDLNSPVAPVVATSGIIVSGFRKPLGTLNGTYDPNSGFTTTGTGLLLVNKTVPNSAIASYVGGAWIRQLAFGFQNIGQIDLIQPRERKVGRAFFVPRGRRLAR